MEPPADEYALALRARDGDREAVAALVERTRLRLFSLAFAELRHYDDAQDAVAAGLLQICLHIGELREPKRVIPWMQRIVRREARRLRRGQDTVPLPPDEAGPATENASALLLRLDIEQALRQLPGQQAQALRLFYLEELSVREIAEQMASPEGRVKIWLHRGRRRLAAEMKGYAPMTQDTPSASPRTPPTPLRCAAVIHTDLTPDLLQTVTEALRAGGFEPKVLSPNDLPEYRADQTLLRDALKDYEALIMDETIGGRSGLEYVLFCKAHAETVNIPITLLHSQEENALLTTACFAAGVTHLARRDDPRAIVAIGEMGEMAKGSWEHFTERARRIVMRAQQEAIARGENYVSTEHLLLGLAGEADCSGARILSEKCGVPLERVREEVQRRAQPGPGRSEGRDLMLTPRGKNVVDHAYDEARRLRHGYIGTEHLLLGLIAEHDGLAGRVLADLGVDLDRTREFVAAWQRN